MRTLLKVLAWLVFLFVAVHIGGALGVMILSANSSCHGQQCLAPAMAGFTFGGLIGGLLGLIALAAFGSRPERPEVNPSERSPAGHSP